MRRGSTRFWLFADGIVICLIVAALSDGLAQKRAGPRRANELTLAGLRPGRSTLAAANQRYGAKDARRLPGDDNGVHWLDCNERDLRVEAGEKTVIESISVSGVLDDVYARHCGAKSDLPRAKGQWKTGRGLAIGDKCERVIALYGRPGSRGPSVKGNRELELFYYSFDWAGSDVPQVMEVSCDRATRKVVEITLASPSL